MAEGLIGSEILRIAAAIRQMQQDGRPVLNFTVGDFDPRYFPIPEKLKKAIFEALEKGETNYPPSNGILELRRAVQRFYERELHLSYPTESVLISSGARPALYGVYRTVVDPGDRVIYPIPSWNNNHYVHLSSATAVPIECRAADGFLPTVASLKKELDRARLLVLNSPLNPTGTALRRDVLASICEAVLEENHRRDLRGDRPLYLLYDQIYWMLCFDHTEHFTPPGLFPEIARYTLLVDGISKAFAATGLRVGWAVGPVDLIERMSSILGHVGAWAPRPEQVATVALLDDVEGIGAYHRVFKEAVSSRLDSIHQGIQRMKSEGLPVESLPPMGAIYLSVRIDAIGRKTPRGDVLSTSESVRQYLLEGAGIAIIPFDAFGVTRDEGWFRLSVGAVSTEQIRTALPLLKSALEALS